MAAVGPVFVEGFCKYFVKCLLILHLPQCFNCYATPPHRPLAVRPQNLTQLKTKATSRQRQGKQMSTTKQTSFFVYCLHCSLSAAPFCDQRHLSDTDTAVQLQPQHQIHYAVQCRGEERRGCPLWLSDEFIMPIVCWPDNCKHWQQSTKVKRRRRSRTWPINKFAAKGRVGNSLLQPTDIVLNSPWANKLCKLMRPAP